MLNLVLGLGLFLAIHLVPQRPDLKERLVGRMGQWSYLGGYRTLHSVIALASIVLIVSGYFDARGEVDVWYPPVWTRHVAATLMLIASILVFAAPFAGKIKEKLTSPLAVALKTWAFAHLLANGSLADIVLFGFFLLFAVSYRISIKKRIAAGLIHIPQGSWKYDILSVLLGVGFYLWMVLHLHEWAFDVPPFA